MAIKVSEAAKGNAPPTGMAKTPSPTRPAPPDAVSHVAEHRPRNDGENGGLNNQSRLNPGERMESDLGKSMRAAVDDDGVLDSIIKNGVKMDLGWQLRESATARRRFIRRWRSAGRTPEVPGASSVLSATLLPGKTGDFDVRRQLGVKRAD